jgi:hypothetical protein
MPKKDKPKPPKVKRYTGRKVEDITEEYHEKKPAASKSKPTPKPSS